MPLAAGRRRNFAGVQLGRHLAVKHGGELDEQRARHRMRAASILVNDCGASSAFHKNLVRALIDSLF
jgi:hypothetical protein